MIEVETPPIIAFGKTAHYLAAKRRLTLIRRYRQQYAQLDEERDNCRLSCDWLAQQTTEDAARLLIEFLSEFTPYLQQRGLAGELAQWCKLGLQACKRLNQNPGWVLLHLAEAQNALGRWHEALSTIQSAIDVCAKVDARVYAKALSALGRLQLNQGRYEQALTTLLEAQTLLAQQSDITGLAAVRSELAAYHLNRYELDKALLIYRGVDELHRQAGAIEETDHTLLMLGVVYRKKQNYDKAARYLTQLLQRSEAHQNRSATATAAHHLAWVYLAEGNLAQSQRFCGQAIALYEAIGDLRGIADAWDQLGLIALDNGNGQEALYNLEKALSLRQQIGNQHGVASCQRHLVVAHYRLRQFPQAIRFMLKSTFLYWQLGAFSIQRLLTVPRGIFELLKQNDRPRSAVISH
jgi:tetratricopeptide (TPR) repeat protein